MGLRGPTSLRLDGSLDSDVGLGGEGFMPLGLDDMQDSEGVAIDMVRK
jgi:hypothetical protein